MKDETRKFLEKAERAFTAAKHLADLGDLEFAVGRAYYAMFYAASGLLLEEGYTFSKHGAVHGAFGEHFAKTGKLDSRLHRMLLDSFDARATGDYGITATFSMGEVDAALACSREFLDKVRQYLDLRTENRS